MDAEQENVVLRELLRKGYALFSDTCLTGEKPDDIKRSRAFCSFELVERLSPGPYLEMFARRRRSGWEAMGDQLEAA